MIGLITTARSFGHLAAYLERGTALSPDDRVAWVEARNLVAEDIDGAAREMADTAALSPRIEKPVYHLSVSFDPDDAVTKDTMVQVADRLLRDLGLDAHQALVVAHRDAYYPHFHVMVNRVNGRTERAIHLAFPYYQIEKSLRHQERTLGLNEAPGKHYRLDGQQFTPNEKELHLPRNTRKAVRSLLQNARSWPELERGLRGVNLQLVVRRDALCVTDGTGLLRTGAVKKGASLAKLERKFGLDWDAYRAERASIWPEMKPTHQLKELHEKSQKARHAMSETDEGSGEERGQAPQESPAEAGAPTGTHARADGHSDYASVLEQLQTLSRVERLEAERAALVEQLGRLERQLAGRLAAVEHLRALDREVDRLFAVAYANPGAARAAYDAEVHLRGLGAATRTLTDAPRRYGRLDTGGWLPVGMPRGPREALEAAAYQGQELHHGLRAAGASLLEVRTASLEEATGLQHTSARHASAGWTAEQSPTPPNGLTAEIGRLQASIEATRGRIEAIGRELAAAPPKKELKRAVEKGWQRLDPKAQKRLVEAARRLPPGPRLGALVQGLGVRAGLEVARESLGKEMTL